MRKARFTEEQHPKGTRGVLKEHEAGATAAMVCRRPGISEPTF
jgi:putative transposase